MAAPDQQFQAIIDQIEQTVKETIANPLKLTPTAGSFDPVAFRQALYAELTTYIDHEVEMLMAMMRRIAVDLYIPSVKHLTAKVFGKTPHGDLA